MALEDKEYEAILQRNKQLINTFVDKLEAEALADKTINTHARNISFFANTFLIDYHEIGVEEGYSHIDDFLGDWFIRKASWPTESSINNNCASFKKFYKFLADENIISKEIYDEVKDTIKHSREDWINSVNYYNA